ncbi:MarR family transcriptional regulator [Rhodococcus sp. HNM0569]|uniref:MarR family winged helix-turn-helix transcriptional regulator n=1 Tax=Rhodococcus sp. HNM0569 TaxID=2716340 RepID=UPI00146F1FDF|nr:MarR family transcriptional regulator [Rhodococcus sp. HNM0569]NLU82320.1 MarR family transcriptional regulator [Rhodococcus sp. HNM0569]
MTDSVDSNAPSFRDPSFRDVVAFRDDVSAFFRRLRSERGDHKLTPSQLQALGHLEREGSMSARELAGFEQVTPQSIARTLAILEEGDMVARVPDPSDARASLVSITEYGHEMLEADRALRSAWLAELLETECTPHERDILFLAGRIMRDLGRPERGAGEPHR